MREFADLPFGVSIRRCDSHDYRGGAYLVPTHTTDRAPLVGTIKRGWMYLSRYGKIVAKEMEADR